MVACVLCQWRLLISAGWIEQDGEVGPAISLLNSFLSCHLQLCFARNALSPTVHVGILLSITNCYLPASRQSAARIQHGQAGHILFNTTPISNHSSQRICAYYHLDTSTPLWFGSYCMGKNGRYHNMQTAGLGKCNNGQRVLLAGDLSGCLLHWLHNNGFRRPRQPNWSFRDGWNMHAKVRPGFTT